MVVFSGSPSSGQRLAQVGGHWGLQRPCEGALGDGPLDAGRIVADVRAAAREPARRVGHDAAVGGPDDPQEVALGPGSAARDARSAGDPARRRGAGGRAYDATSSVTSTFFRAARLGLAGASAASTGAVRCRLGLGGRRGCGGLLGDPLGLGRAGFGRSRPGRRARLRRVAASAVAASAAAASAAAFLVIRFGLAGATAATPSASTGVAASVVAVGVAVRALRGRLGLGDRDVAADVDPPAGQSRGQPGVLALAADGQREHALGHGHARDAVLLVDVDGDDLGGAEGVGHEDGRVVVPGDDVDLLPGQLGHDRLDARPALPDGRPDGVEALLARRDRHLRAAARLTGDGLDLDGPAVDLGHFELEQALQEALVSPADEDLRTLGGAPDLEDERLDVLPDAVVLEGALLGGREDRLHALADVEDDRARLDPIDRPGHQLAFAARELVEDLVALDLADALQDDLLGRLGADPAEDVAIELLGLDHVADAGGRVEGLGLLDGHLGQFVLDLVDDATRPIDADLARLGVDPDVDVLVAGDAPVGRLDAVLDRPDELLAGDLLLGVELEEGTNEVSTHDVPPFAVGGVMQTAAQKQNVGVTHVTERPFSWTGSIHPDAWTLKREPSVRTSIYTAGSNRSTVVNGGGAVRHAPPRR